MQLPELVTVEPTLFEDRCRVTVVHPGGRRQRPRPEVYTDLTWEEAKQLLEDVGVLAPFDD